MRVVVSIHLVQVSVCCNNLGDRKDHDLVPRTWPTSYGHTTLLFSTWAGLNSTLCELQSELRYLAVANFSVFNRYLAFNFHIGISFFYSSHIFKVSTKLELWFSICWEFCQEFWQLCSSNCIRFQLFFQNYARNRNVDLAWVWSEVECEVWREILLLISACFDTER